MRPAPRTAHPAPRPAACRSTAALGVLLLSLACGGHDPTGTSGAAKPLAAPYLTYDVEGGSLSNLAEGGGRLLGNRSDQVVRREGGHWVRDDAGLAGAALTNIVDALWVDTTGEAWAGVRQTCADDAEQTCLHVFHSVRAGAAWSEVPAPPAPFQRIGTDIKISGFAGHGPVVVGSYVRRAPYNTVARSPVVLRWDGGGWTDLRLPAAAADSLGYGGAAAVATRGTDEVYLGGSVNVSSLNSNTHSGHALLGALTAAAWSFPAVAPTGGSCRGDVRSLGTAAGGATFGVGAACGPDTAAYPYPTGTVLFRVANGAVTLVDNPLTQRGTAIGQVVAGPGGRIALVHDHGVVWQRDDATWRTYGEYAFADGATPYGRAWWAADGTLWLLVTLGNTFQLAAVHIALP